VWASRLKRQLGHSVAKGRGTKERKDTEENLNTHSKDSAENAGKKGANSGVFSGLCGLSDTNERTKRGTQGRISTRTEEGREKGGWRGEGDHEGCDKRGTGAGPLDRVRGGCLLS